MSYLSILYFVATISACSDAFVLQSSRARKNKPFNGHRSVGRDLPDIDSARQVFEGLFQEDVLKNQLFIHENDEDVSMMSSISRRRREIEIKLLESLNDSDDAVEELMHLWVAERGDEFASKIMEMEKECSVGLFEEEVLLRRMIQKHPCWAEPVIRLATLLFYKGITKESYLLAMHAMHLKPWHIEVPQLLVLLALREQDMAKAIYWARRGLPALSRTNQRRKEWVEMSLQLAQEQLVEVERKREEYCERVKRSKESTNTNAEHPVWE